MNDKQEIISQIEAKAGVQEAKNAAKVYTLKWERRGSERSTSGTVEQLTRYFGYTLECGNSYNPKINRKPKTIKALVSAINRSYEETQASCYERTYVYVAQ